MEMDIEANTLIGERSVFEGKLAVKGNLRIDGRFEGKTLHVEHLQVGPKAKIRTDIHAASVVIEGLVIGNITASTRILLFSTARVLGDIKTPEMIFHDGVIFYGRCAISHMEIENTKAYIESLDKRKG